MPAHWCALVRYFDDGRLTLATNQPNERCHAAGRPV